MNFANMFFVLDVKLWERICVSRCDQGANSEKYRSGGGGENLFTFCKFKIQKWYLVKSRRRGRRSLLLVFHIKITKWYFFK